MTMVIRPEYITMPVWRPEEDHDMTSRIAKDMAGLLHVPIMICVIVKRKHQRVKSRLGEHDGNRLQDLRPLVKEICEIPQGVFVDKRMNMYLLSVATHRHETLSSELSIRTSAANFSAEMERPRIQGLL